MNLKRYIRLVALGLLAASVLLAWRFAQNDAAQLHRSIEAVAEEKRAKVLAGFASRGSMQAEATCSVWRKIPLMGKPQAKVEISLAQDLKAGAVFRQSLDYFYEWGESGWVEMKPNCGKQCGAGSSGEHVH